MTTKKKNTRKHTTTCGLWTFRHSAHVLQSYMCDKWQAHMLRCVWYAQSLEAHTIGNTTRFICLSFLHSIGFFLEYFLRFSTNIVFFPWVFLYIKNNIKCLLSSTDPFCKEVTGFRWMQLVKSAMMSWLSSSRPTWLQFNDLVPSLWWIRTKWPIANAIRIHLFSFNNSQFRQAEIKFSHSIMCNI